MRTDRRMERVLGDLGELLAARGDGALDPFRTYADDPVAFAREVLDVEPWSAQREALAAIPAHKQVLVQGGNGTGKDFATAIAALWWVFARGGLVLTTAATERQGVDVWMKEASRLWRGAPELPGELYAASLRVPAHEGAGIYTFTSTSASKLSGFHEDRVLAILSEAQEIEPFGWEGMMACAVGADDRLVASGNPVRPSGRFYVAARSGDWHRIRISVFDHPNLDPGSDRFIPGGPSEDFARRIEREWGGKASPIYVARVLGRFPEDGEGSLVRRGWLDAAAGRHEEWAELAAANRKPVTLGVDVARYGPDATVCAVRQGDVLREFRTWSGLDTMATAARIRKLALEVGALSPHEAVEIRVDEIGMGAGVLDRLRELGVPARGYKGSRAPSDSRRFTNARAEGYWQLRRALEEDEIALPADEPLFEELLATSWEASADGKVKIARKAGMKGRLGRSPDRADAVVMAFFAPRRRAVGVDIRLY